ncbi:MAG: hypothetical protein RhofKO_20130 [Rhodothermales bacterium]
MRLNLQSIPAVLSTLLLLLTFSSCDVANLGADIEDAVNLVISVPPVETVATLQVLDANTGEAVQQPVQVEFVGPASVHVVDQFLFEPLPKTRTESGVVTFAFPDGLPYGGTPYALKAQVKADGYFDAAAAIRIAGPGRYTFQAKLVKALAPPAGIVVATQPSGTADASGTTQQTVTVQTPTDATTGTSAAVTVAAGTQVTAASGQPAQGNLSTTVVYNSGQTPEARAVAVSATADIPIAQADGSAVTGSLVTHSMFQVQLTDGSGQVMTRLSQPLEVAVPLPETNLLTGAPYVEGEVLTAYAKDSATGTWRELPPATVGGKRLASAVRVERRAGTLSAVTMLDQLDANQTQVAIGNAFHTKEVRFKVGTDLGEEAMAALGALPPLSLRIGIDRARGTTSDKSTWASHQSATHYEIEIIGGEVFIAVWDGAIDVTVELPGLDSPVEASVDYLYASVDPFLTAIVSTPEIDVARIDIPATSLFADGEVELTVSADDLTSTASASQALGRVDLELDCHAIDPTKGVIRPSTQFQYARQKEGTSGAGGALGPGAFVSPGQTGNLNSGKAELMLELGTIYQVSVNYKGDTYRDTFTTPATADADGSFDVEVNLTDEQIRSVCNKF